MSSSLCTIETLKPHPGFSFPLTDNQNTDYSDCRASNTGYWDFLLQTPTNSSQHFKQATTKPSTFSLNTTSLEMCTEVLGSESGSYIDTSLDTGHYSSKVKPRRTCKRTKHVTNFPPPLTSISSGYGVKVEARRGGGRLVITAFVSSSACMVYLRSEREDGRLRVFLRKEYYYYKRSEQQLYEKIKGNGGKIRRKLKCGDESGSKNLTSLLLCLV